MKKIPLLVWPGKLKTWWSFLLILLILGANKATLSEWSYLWGHPGGRLRCLTSSGIPTTTTKLRASQKSDLFNFWGAPMVHTIPEQMIKDPVGSIHKKYNARKQTEGNHFESFL